MLLQRTAGFMPVPGMETCVAEEGEGN